MTEEKIPVDNKKHHKTHKKHKSHKASEEVEFNKTTLWQIISAILVIALVIVIVLKPATVNNDLSEEEIGTLVTNFVNENMLQEGVSALVMSVDKTNGLYKVQLNVQGQTFDSYISEDGEVFFAQGAIVIDEFEAAKGAADAPAQAAPAAQDVPKTDKPVVELFVMSHCPYGTQMEKGMLPVVDLLGDQVDFQVKFVNYAMHGKTEVDEQLNQYCIQQEYPDEYFAYLQCFLKEGKTDTCVSELGFDSDKLSACITETDGEFGVTDSFEDQASWLNGRYPVFAIHDEENKEYGVRGSPTLVVNGVSLSSARDPSSLKDAICNAFENAPEECNEVLPSDSPSPGFGYGTTASGQAAANCIV